MACYFAQVGEYTGAEVAEIYTRSYNDGRAMHILWSILEKEIGLQRTSGTLGMMSL